MSSLTAKQEAFARAYVETGNASEAYRRAYNSGNMGANTIHVNACNLLKNNKVALRVAQLQEKHAKRHEITVDTITEMLKEDRRLAHQEKQTSAAVSAAMGIAKLHGLIVDKFKGELKRDVSDLSDAELAAIATSGSERALEETESPPASSGLH